MKFCKNQEIGPKILVWINNHYCIHIFFRKELIFANTHGQVGYAFEISRGPRVPDHFGGNYPRVITQGFWGSEKVGRSDR